MLIEVHHYAVFQMVIVNQHSGLFYCVIVCIIDTS